MKALVFAMALAYATRVIPAQQAPSQGTPPLPDYLPYLEQQGFPYVAPFPYPYPPTMQFCIDNNIPAALCISIPRQ
jgi:hypothetical protein